MMPPSTSTSGSTIATRLAAAMPRYFAVSRTTEIDTPSPRARRVEHVVERDRGEIVADRVLHARAIAGLDAPDQPPHDAGRRDFGFEAADLPVVLALDRVERQPGDGRRATVRAGHGTPCADDAGHRVIADREEARRRARRAPRRPTPRRRRGGARRHGALAAERPAVARARAPRAPPARRPRRAPSAATPSGASGSRSDADDAPRAPRPRPRQAGGRRHFGARARARARRRRPTTATTRRVAQFESQHVRSVNLALRRGRQSVVDVQLAAQPAAAAASAARRRRNESRGPRASSSADSSRSSGALHDEHAAALGRRKPPIVEVVAVQRHQRAPQLLRQPVVPHVGRPPQVVVLEHEQHVPLQARAHVGRRGPPARWRRRRCAAARSGVRRAAPSSDDSVPMAVDAMTSCLSSASRAAFACARQARDQLVALVDELLARAGGRSAIRRRTRRTAGTRSSSRSRRRRCRAARPGSPCPS